MILGGPPPSAGTVVVALAALLVGPRGKVCARPAGSSTSPALGEQPPRSWMVDHIYTGVPVVGGTVRLGLALHHLESSTRSRDGLQVAWPWWSWCCSWSPRSPWSDRLPGQTCAHRRRPRWPRSACSVVWNDYKFSLDTLVAGPRRCRRDAGLLSASATGIAAARRRALRGRLLRPVLDVFQTMPQFVYLIPVVRALRHRPRSPAVAAACRRRGCPPSLPLITYAGPEPGRRPPSMESSRSLGALQLAAAAQGPAAAGRAPR